MNNNDPVALLTDAVDYQLFRSPFHGDAAQFACLYASGTPVGIGPTHARSAQFTRFITTTTLQLWICDGATWQAVPRYRMISHPTAAREESRYQIGGTTVQVSARTIYEDARTAWHEQILVNDGEGPLDLECACCGQVDADREVDPKRCHGWIDDVKPREFFVEQSDHMIRCGYRGRPELPGPALQIQALTGIERAERMDLPVWAEGFSNSWPGRSTHFAFRSGKRYLRPGDQIRLLFRLSYVPSWHASPQSVWPKPATTIPDLDAIEKRAEDRLRQRLTTAVHDSRLLRARYTLMRCGYQGIDGSYGPRRSCLCTPGITAFSVTFFWDALFSAAALSSFDPEYAREAMQVPLQQIRGRYLSRNWDFRIHRLERVPQPQAPVASWALAHHLALNEDHRHLELMYPRLTALHRFWQTQDFDGDGLPEWTFSGLNADDGPHYQKYMPHGGSNLFLPPVASVSLASFLHMDALLLAGFALRLGRNDEAAEWQKRAQFLAERLQAVCWHEGDRMFYDYDHHLGEHSRVGTHLIFWPLWAGVPMAAPLKRRLIEDHLLNPRRFAGPIPFPSCAYDDPHYGAEKYWGGRSWPHITYWMIELLVREGYRDQALVAADRWLAWQSGHGGHREAVTSDPHLSEHVENGEFSYRTGRDFDYNWSAATVALLRERRFDQFVPLMDRPQPIQFGKGSA